MAFGKRSCNDKSHGTRNSKRASESTEITGCSIPLQSGCLTGTSPPSTVKKGIKMQCSYAACPFKDTLMHLECVQAFEDLLVKIMSTVGSARGWTDSQRRANLWDKKGLALIQKRCRCKCGMGVLCRDDSAAFLMERQEATTEKDLKTKKAKCKKQLPKLNYNGPTTAVMLEEKQDKTNQYQWSRSRTQSSTMSNYLIDSSVTASPDPSPPPPAPKGVWIRDLSLAAIPLQLDGRRSAGAITYAEAALNAANSDCWSESSRGEDSVCSSRRMSETTDTELQDAMRDELNINDVFLGDSIQRSVSCATDYHTSFFTTERQQPALDFTQQEKELMHSDLGNNGLQMDMSTVLLSPPGTPSPFAELVKLKEEKRSYNIFRGPSFCLGEKIIAQMYLPGAV